MKELPATRSFKLMSEYINLIFLFHSTFKAEFIDYLKADGMNVLKSLLEDLSILILDERFSSEKLMKIETKDHNDMKFFSNYVSCLKEQIKLITTQFKENNNMNLNGISPIVISNLSNLYFPKLNRRIQFYDDFISLCIKTVQIFTFFVTDVPAVEQNYLPLGGKIIDFISDIFDKIVKENLNSRKELLYYTKAVIKKFSPHFKERFHIFRKEDKFMQIKNSIHYDYFYHEVNRFYFALIETLVDQLSIEDKLVVLDDLIRKINNFNLSYDSKLSTFFYLQNYFDVISRNFTTIGNYRKKVVDLGGKLLREVAGYFENIYHISQIGDSISMNKGRINYSCVKDSLIQKLRMINLLQEKRKEDKYKANNSNTQSVLVDMDDITLEEEFNREKFILSEIIKTYNVKNSFTFFSTSNLILDKIFFNGEDTTSLNYKNEYSGFSADNNNEIIKHEYNIDSEKSNFNNIGLFDHSMGNSMDNAINYLLEYSVDNVENKIKEKQMNLANNNSSYFNSTVKDKDFRDTSGFGKDKETCNCQLKNSTLLFEETNADILCEEDNDYSNINNKLNKNIEDDYSNAKKISKEELLNHNTYFNITELTNRNNKRIFDQLGFTQISTYLIISEYQIQESMRHLLPIISQAITILNFEKPETIERTHSKTKSFKKLVKYFLLLSEKMMKNHNHNNPTQNNNNEETILLTFFKYFFSIQNNNIVISVFTDMMPIIHKILINNSRICTDKNCMISYLVDSIFDSKKDLFKDTNLKKQLFEIYLDYFISQTYLVGNISKPYCHFNSICFLNNSISNNSSLYYNYTNTVNNTLNNSLFGNGNYFSSNVNLNVNNYYNNLLNTSNSNNSSNNFYTNFNNSSNINNIKMKNLIFYQNRNSFVLNIKENNSNTQNSCFSNVSSSTLIDVLKALFRYLDILLLERIEDQSKISNFLMMCLILTKNSKYFGNYIYLIRCLFKSLFQITTNNNMSNPNFQNNSNYFDFYKETIHLVYGILNTLVHIKENYPFLKEMLTEIIIIFPIKFKYMIEHANIVFPSLMDALNMSTEIIPIGFSYLEQWMNALYHKPENVKPYLQGNISQITTLLTSHLYKGYHISLNSLKLLSKFGGRSRNYMEDKIVNPKTSPTNILKILLFDKDYSAEMGRVKELCEGDYNLNNEDGKSSEEYKGLYYSNYETCNEFLWYDNKQNVCYNNTNAKSNNNYQNESHNPSNSHENKEDSSNTKSDQNKNNSNSHSHSHNHSKTHKNPQFEDNDLIFKFYKNTNYLEFSLDNIVDLCIKLLTNHKKSQDKNWLIHIKSNFTILKSCFLIVISKSTDFELLYSTVSEIKATYYHKNNISFYTQKYKNQIKDILPSPNITDFSINGYKINLIYRKAEQFLIEKLLRGIFLCCTIPGLEDEIKDFVQYVCFYFVLIMVSKNKYNSCLGVLEVDPTMIFEIICEFLFSLNPTIFKNNNQASCSLIAIKLLSIMIDTVLVIFNDNINIGNVTDLINRMCFSSNNMNGSNRPIADCSNSNCDNIGNNYKLDDSNYPYLSNVSVMNSFDSIFLHLEIVDIIFYKIINTCYINEWAKKGGGVSTLITLVRKFPSIVSFKYLDLILRAIFYTGNIYSNIVKVKFETDCSFLLQDLLSLFIIEKINFIYINLSRVITWYVKDVLYNHHRSKINSINNNDINDISDNKTLPSYIHTDIQIIRKEFSIYFSALNTFNQFIIENLNSLSDYTHILAKECLEQIISTKFLRKCSLLFGLIDCFKESQYLELLLMNIITKEGLLELYLIELFINKKNQELEKINNKLEEINYSNVDLINLEHCVKESKDKAERILNKLKSKTNLKLIINFDFNINDKEELFWILGDVIVNDLGFSTNYFNCSNVRNNCVNGYFYSGRSKKDTVLCKLLIEDFRLFLFEKLKALFDDNNDNVSKIKNNKSSNNENDIIICDENNNTKDDGLNNNNNSNDDKDSSNKKNTKLELPIFKLTENQSINNMLLLKLIYLKNSNNYSNIRMNKTTNVLNDTTSTNNPEIDLTVIPQLMNSNIINSIITNTKLLSKKLVLNIKNYSQITNSSKALVIILKFFKELYSLYIRSDSIVYEKFLSLLSYLYEILLLDHYLYLEISFSLQKHSFYGKFKYFFIEKFLVTGQCNFKLEQSGKIIPIDEILTKDQLESITKYVNSTHFFIFEQHQQTNKYYSTIEPHIYDLFPNYSNKLKMVKYVIKAMKYLLTEKIEFAKKLENMNIFERSVMCVDNFMTECIGSANNNHNNNSNNDDYNNNKNNNYYKYEDQLLNSDFIFSYYNINRDKANNTNNNSNQIIDNNSLIHLTTPSLLQKTTKLLQTTNSLKFNFKQFSNSFNDRFEKNKFETTRLIFKSIMYRDENIILSSAMKIIRRVVQLIQLPTEKILPEEDLKNCIKPILEKVSAKVQTSYKILNSLTILVKLLSNNFNSSLAKKLNEKLKTGNEAIDYNFSYAIISLLSYLKLNYITEQFNDVFDFILKMERENVMQQKGFVLFKSKFKKCVVKMLTNSEISERIKESLFGYLLNPAINNQSNQNNGNNSEMKFIFGKIGLSSIIYNKEFQKNNNPNYTSHNDEYFKDPPTRYFINVLIEEEHSYNLREKLARFSSHYLFLELLCNSNQAIKEKHISILRLLTSYSSSNNVYFNNINTPINPILEEIKDQALGFLLIIKMVKKIVKVSPSLLLVNFLSNKETVKLVSRCCPHFNNHNNNNSGRTPLFTFYHYLNSKSNFLGSLYMNDYKNLISLLEGIFVKYIDKGQYCEFNNYIEDILKEICKIFIIYLDNFDLSINCNSYLEGVFEETKYANSRSSIKYMNDNNKDDLIDTDSNNDIYSNKDPSFSSHNKLVLDNEEKQLRPQILFYLIQFTKRTRVYSNFKDEVFFYITKRIYFPLSLNVKDSSLRFNNSNSNTFYTAANEPYFKSCKSTNYNPKQELLSLNSNNHCMNELSKTNYCLLLYYKKLNIFLNRVLMHFIHEFKRCVSKISTDYNYQQDFYSYKYNQDININFSNVNLNSSGNSNNGNNNNINLEHEYIKKEYFLTKKHYITEYLKLLVVNIVIFKRDNNLFPSLNKINDITKTQDYTIISLLAKMLLEDSHLKHYENPLFLEIIKTTIVMNSYFNIIKTYNNDYTKARSENYKNQCKKIYDSKLSSSFQAVSLHSNLGLFSLNVDYKSPPYIQYTINSFSKQSQVEIINFYNLCLDYATPELLRNMDYYEVLKSLSSYINDRNSYIGHFLIFFLNTLKNFELIHLNGHVLGNMITSFLKRTHNRIISPNISTYFNKKILIQLFGLCIYWLKIEILRHYGLYRVGKKSSCVGYKNNNNNINSNMINDKERLDLKQRQKQNNLSFNKKIGSNIYNNIDQKDIIELILFNNNTNYGKFDNLQPQKPLKPFISIDPISGDNPNNDLIVSTQINTKVSLDLIEKLKESVFKLVYSSYKLVNFKAISNLSNSPFAHFIINNTYSSIPNINTNPALSNDIENWELAKRYIIYMKEIFKIGSLSNAQFLAFTDLLNNHNKSISDYHNDLRAFLIPYFYYIKNTVLYFHRHIFYQEIEVFMNVFKIMYEINSLKTIVELSPLIMLVSNIEKYEELNYHSYVNFDIERKEEALLNINDYYKEIFLNDNNNNDSNKKYHKNEIYKVKIFDSINTNFVEYLNEITYRYLEYSFEKQVFDFLEYLKNNNKKQNLNQNTSINSEFEIIIKYDIKSRENNFNLHPSNSIEAIKNKLVDAANKVFESYPHLDFRYFLTFYFYMCKTYKLNYVDIDYIESVIEKNNCEEYLGNVSISYSGKNSSNEVFGLSGYSEGRSNKAQEKQATNEMCIDSYNDIVIEDSSYDISNGISNNKRKESLINNFKNVNSNNTFEYDLNIKNKNYRLTSIPIIYYYIDVLKILKIKEKELENLLLITNNNFDNKIISTENKGDDNNKTIESVDNQINAYNTNNIHTSNVNNISNDINPSNASINNISKVINYNDLQNIIMNLNKMGLVFNDLNLHINNTIKDKSVKLSNNNNNIENNNYLLNLYKSSQYKIKAKHYKHNFNYKTLLINKQLEVLSKYYLENWYIYTYNTLQIIREDDKAKFLETNDFTSVTKFAYILGLLSNDQIYKYKLEDTLCFNDFASEKHGTLLETVLLGFLLAFHNHSFFNAYKKNILSLFLNMFNFLMKTIINPIMERIVVLLINEENKLDIIDYKQDANRNNKKNRKNNNKDNTDNKDVNEKNESIPKLDSQRVIKTKSFLSTEEKCKFLLDLYKTYENNSSIKIPNQIINLSINILEQYSDKIDRTINDLLKILLILSKKQDIITRNRIYGLFEKLKGKSIFEKVKLIFQIDTKLSENYYQTWVTFAVDFLLSHFHYNGNIIRNKCFSILGPVRVNNSCMFKNKNECSYNNHQKQVNMELYKNSSFEMLMINSIIENINAEMKNLKTNNLMFPVREIISSDLNSSLKLFSQIFPFVWKLLSRTEQEQIPFFINEFLFSSISNQSTIHKSIYLIRNLIETLINCSPMIKIQPELLIALVKNFGCWNAVLFYFEKMITINVDVDRHFFSIDKMCDVLREDDYIIGLKRDYVIRNKKMIMDVRLKAKRMEISMNNKLISNSNRNNLLKDKDNNDKLTLSQSDLTYLDRFKIKLLNETNEGLNLLQEGNYQDSEKAFKGLFENYSHLLNNIELNENESEKLKEAIDVRNCNTVDVTKRYNKEEKYTGENFYGRCMIEYNKRISKQLKKPNVAFNDFTFNNNINLAYIDPSKERDVYLNYTEGDIKDIVTKMNEMTFNNNNDEVEKDFISNYNNSFHVKSKSQSKNKESNNHETLNNYNNDDLKDFNKRAKESLHKSNFLIDLNIEGNNNEYANIYTVNNSNSNMIIENNESNIISYDNYNLSHTDKEKNLILLPELSIWQSGLVESLKNINKWSEVHEIAEITNNMILKIESLWNLGKWDKIEELSSMRTHYLEKINQIYCMMNKREDTNKSDQYQSICMEGIKLHFSEFSAYPINFERLNYHYYLIFQQLVEAWESNNTLKEMEKTIINKDKERKNIDFRENLIMWRDRMPHVCEGFQALKSILDPRDYLFRIMKDTYEQALNNESNTNGGLISEISILNNFSNLDGCLNNGNINHDYVLSNFSDHVWNNYICLRYARKLKLTNVYKDYNSKFLKNVEGVENIYQIELHLKTIEDFKYIKYISKNYSFGIKLANEYIEKLSGQNLTTSNKIIQTFKGGVSQQLQLGDLEKEIKACYLGFKGYFYYKQGKLQDSYNCFVDSVSYVKTNYKIWVDFADVNCKILNGINDEYSELIREQKDKITDLNDMQTKSNNESLLADIKKMEVAVDCLEKEKTVQLTTWLENTINNYFLACVYKLDNSKYYLVRIFSILKKYNFINIVYRGSGNKNSNTHTNNNQSTEIIKEESQVIQGNSDVYDNNQNNSYLFSNLRKEENEINILQENKSIFYDHLTSVGPWVYLFYLPQWFELLKDSILCHVGKEILLHIIHQNSQQVYYYLKIYLEEALDYIKNKNLDKKHLTKLKNYIKLLLEIKEYQVKLDLQKLHYPMINEIIEEMEIKAIRKPEEEIINLISTHINLKTVNNLNQAKSGVLLVYQSLIENYDLNEVYIKKVNFDHLNYEAIEKEFDYYYRNKHFNEWREENDKTKIEKKAKCNCCFYHKDEDLSLFIDKNTRLIDLFEINKVSKKEVMKNQTETYRALIEKERLIALFYIKKMNESFSRIFPYGFNYDELINKKNDDSKDNNVKEDITIKHLNSKLLFEFFRIIKNIKNYLYSKVATESIFEDLENVIHSNFFLFNSNYEVEVPGINNFKFTDNSQNKVYISRFETEFHNNFKSINFVNKKIILRGSNEKLYNFYISRDEDFKEIKVIQLQSFLNTLFYKNKDSFKRSVKFLIPNKIFISKGLKIVQEDNYQYSLKEIYEFSLQRRGFAVDIHVDKFEEFYLEKFNDESRLDSNADSKLSMDFKGFSDPEYSDINANVYDFMNNICQEHNLQNFIHKFVINYEEIFIFRKQFSASYAINSYFNYITKTNTKLFLENIIMNKDTGNTLVNNTKFLSSSEFSLNSESENIPFRLGNNIQMFITNISVYGTIPGIINAVINVLEEKLDYFYSGLFTFLFESWMLSNKRRETSLEQENSFFSNYCEMLIKRSITLDNDSIAINNELFFNDEDDEDEVNEEIGEFINENINNNNVADNHLNNNNEENSDNERRYQNARFLNTIIDRINESINEENLREAPIFYETWF